MPDDPETALRRLWDARGVPKERQDAMIAEIERKAQPTYWANAFPKGEPS